MNLLNSDHFWQFACTLYAKPDQQQTLLALQKQLNELTQVVSDFDTRALQPLRAARSYLKANQNAISDYATIRAELLSAELKLEKQQQHMLIETVNELELVKLSEPNNIELYVKAT